jgi:hypothetical protein
VSGIEQRIADVLLDHMGEYADDEDGRDWAGYVASVLVAELGLREDRNFMVKTNNVPWPPDAERIPCRRYVTDWERAE